MPQAHTSASANKPTAIATNGHPVATSIFDPNRPLFSSDTFVQTANSDSFSHAPATAKLHTKLNQRINGLSVMRSKKGSANTSTATIRLATIVAVPSPPKNMYALISGKKSSNANNCNTTITTMMAVYAKAKYLIVSSRGRGARVASIFLIPLVYSCVIA